MKKVSIFYKNLIEPGGAERLLVKVYENLTNDGYDVDIIGYKINKEALFGVKVNDDKLIEFGSKYSVINFIKLINYMRRNKSAFFLCDSGHLDVYLASIFSQTKYSLHLHHPLFMSFNDYDKYSVFLKRFFAKRIKSNFGASRFVEIQNGLSIKTKIFLNIRAKISILSIKNSLNNFVLSAYAKEEKKELFGVNSEVVCGALENDIFKFKPKGIDEKYDKYDSLILTVGRLDINKRISELIQAFKILKDEGLNVGLLIGGKGPEYNNLKILAENLDLQDDIYFLGFISEEDLYDYYHRVDLFASIDWADYRITSYEALAMGTKVLLSDETDTDKFLIDSKYLYITSPTIKDTAKCMKQALKDKPIVSESELFKYLKDFTWKKYTRKLINIMETNV